MAQDEKQVELPEHIQLLYEASKRDDYMIVGSELREVVAELRKALTERGKARDLWQKTEERAMRAESRLALIDEMAEALRRMNRLFDRFYLKKSDGGITNADQDEVDGALILMDACLARYEEGKAEGQAQEAGKNDEWAAYEEGAKYAGNQHYCIPAKDLLRLIAAARSAALPAPSGAAIDEHDEVKAFEAWWWSEEAPRDGQMEYDIALAGWLARARRNGVECERAQKAEAERDDYQRRYEHCKMQAEIWAQEARSQTATVHECYAAAGVQGNGTFNGAVPVKEQFEALRARIQQLERVLVHGT